MDPFDLVRKGIGFSLFLFCLLTFIDLSLFLFNFEFFFEVVFWLVLVFLRSLRIDCVENVRIWCSICVFFFFKNFFCNGCFYLILWNLFARVLI